MKTSSFLLFITTGILMTASTQTPDPLLHEDFESTQPGSLAKKLLAHQNISLSETGGKDGSKGIRVAYVGSHRGSDRVVMDYYLNKPVQKATLSFDVLFEEGFQWVLGGKLHGLGPKNPITGGQTRRPKGWSARVMFKENGKILTYLYDQDQEKKWGYGNKTKIPVFAVGQWHHVEISVVLNTAGEANGSTRVCIDGEEVLFTQEVEFRGEAGKDTLIQKFLFSTFHGGHELKYAPVDSNGKPVTVYARFDNFLVMEDVD